MIQIIGFFKNYCNRTFLKSWIRCGEFLATEKHKVIHDFLKHYDEGKSIPFEEKPLDIIRYSGLTIYYIEFKKYDSFYSFYDSENRVDDFLRNVKYRFESTNQK